MDNIIRSFKIYYIINPLYLVLQGLDYKTGDFPTSHSLPTVLRFQNLVPWDES